MNIRLLLICAVMACHVAKPVLAAEANADPLGHIKHIIVISLENHSFDNLFGKFPGAEGIDQAGDTVVQTDKNGALYATLPPVMSEENGRRVSDIRFPPDLPNHPFPIDTYVPANQKTSDLVHRFYQQQEQINGGRMDRFAALSDAGGLVMGYYDGSKSALWEYAKKYTLADRFFHAAFGGSFINHFWMVCACTPRFDNAPAEMAVTLDSAGKLMKDGAVTPDGYAVNTVFPSATPHPAEANSAHLLPPQEMPTIGDRLSEKGVSWAWYAGGWNDALVGKPDATFQFHHQPFAYFRNYADGTPARAEHLKDEVDFLYALKDGSLPAVSFYKPLGEYSLHPGYATMASGDARLGTMLKAIEQSPVWSNSVVIVTFDENGGYWDHVPPPTGDRWGPAMRVPTLIISPFARKGYVDHTVYDTTSILKLIETRFGLTPLGERDAKANNFAAALSTE